MEVVAVGLRRGLVCFAFFVPAGLLGQSLFWQGGVSTFIENHEFVGSALQGSQTMSGVHFVPSVGVSLERGHRIVVGADLMREFGSVKFVDYADPIVYYAYVDSGRGLFFYGGAVSREVAVRGYPRMFFSDSIGNYRPTVNGFVLAYRCGGICANAWLDWTGRQSPTRREAFLMGWSGRYGWKTLYMQHFGYMYHLAKRRYASASEGVHDNGLVLTLVGIDMSGQTFLSRLSASLGWSAGLERDRSAGGWHILQGFVSETCVGYKYAEIVNTYYRGSPQQRDYERFGSELYWGDPFYRANVYDRLDLNVHFMRAGAVSLQLTCSLHFVEGRVYNAQAFRAVVVLGNNK